MQLNLNWFHALKRCLHTRLTGLPHSNTVLYMYTICILYMLQRITVIGDGNQIEISQL